MVVRATLVAAAVSRATGTTLDAVQWPEGFDPRAVVRPLLHSALMLTGPDGAAYRRGVTERSPLRFALVYLEGRLRQQDTGQLSFADMHLDLCRAATSWPAGGQRDIWVGPRGVGKTEWMFVCLPLWALAHGHRRFLLALSHGVDQATGHLANLRMELAENSLLLDDFPELAPRRRTPGARNTATTVVANGATLAARGLSEGMLGLRVGTARADLIVGDDLEPVGSKYSPAAKLKLQETLINGVLRMGSRDPVVQLNGTVTMRDSMIHDAVKVARGELTEGNAWVTAHGFWPRHYRPIVEGRSVWAQRWSVADLKAERARDPRDFALNMECDPSDTDVNTVWWTDADFRYDSAFPVHSRVLHVDTATTAHGRSDSTVLVLAARDASGRRCCVEYVVWGQWRPEETREKIRAVVGLCGDRLPLVRVEGNQGGDTWKSSLAPWPLGVQVEITHADEQKERRIEKAHNAYAALAVVHARRMAALETELKLWPRGQHDDVPDAVAGAVQWCLKY